MSDSSGTGFVALNDNMYFTCSSGLMPAKIQATQLNHKTAEKYNYLVKDDTGCPAVGDFMCRWAVVLAAAIAAAGVVTGGAALAVLAVAAIAVSMAMCGGLMAPMRKWVGYSRLNAYGRKDAYSLTSKCQMVCPIGGVITYAPGITSEWQALAYMARNTTWAVLEGAIVGKLYATGSAAVAIPETATALANFALLFAGSSAVGAAEQSIFEGVLRNGKDIAETGEEAKQGATWFWQPSKTISERVNSGYYTGGYAKDAEGKDIEEAHNGHGVGAATTDAYYAALSTITLGMLGKASNRSSIAREAFLAANEAVGRAMKGGKRFLFERAKKSGADRAKQYASSWPLASLKEAVSKFIGSNPIVEGPTPKGKLIYRNQTTGMEVVYDVNGNYFRIQNTNLPGKRISMDMDGNVPNNKMLPGGQQKGRSQSEYNEVTHFNNTDPIPPKSSITFPNLFEEPPIDDNDDD